LALTIAKDGGGRRIPQGNIIGRVGILGLVANSRIFSMTACGMKIQTYIKAMDRQTRTSANRGGKAGVKYN
jgi:hypothetical protein